MICLPDESKISLCRDRKRLTNCVAALRPFKNCGNCERKLGAKPKCHIHLGVKTLYQLITATALILAPLSPHTPYFPAHSFLDLHISLDRTHYPFSHSSTYFHTEHSILLSLYLLTFIISLTTVSHLPKYPQLNFFPYSPHTHAASSRIPLHSTFIYPLTIIRKP